jgi:electron transport complex protein RnfA
MTSYLMIFIVAIFVNNVVLAQFLGVCPFLGVSKKNSTALGMGFAVMFVLTLASVATYIIHHALLIPLNLIFMQTVVFILVIASLVQMLEIMMKKVSPSLYQALGIFLPLLTTNCAILGVVILCVQRDFNLMQTACFSLANGMGFTLAIILFAGMRERFSRRIPKPLQGAPIALITAGLLSLAFMGFAGIGT